MDLTDAREDSSKTPMAFGNTIWGLKYDSKVIITKRKSALPEISASMDYIVLKRNLPVRKTTLEVE